MLETVTAYIEHHYLLPASGKIIVAVSGGADSLCLLHLLHRLCGPDKRYPELQLHAAHLNHKLRGEASVQDASAVASIVAFWGLPFALGEVDVPEFARRERKSLEDAARTARYRFLREIAQGQPIAVAHHADDQLETLALHWLRGSGLAGMVGMLPRQQDIIRPLLAVSHAETVAYCQQHSIIPVEDASNTDARFLRNRIRHELLPLLESLNPGIRSTLLRNAEVMRVDVEWIETQVGTYWPTVVITVQDDIITVNVKALLALPSSLQRHLLRRLTARLYQGQSPLEARHYALIEQILHHEDGQERTLHLPQRLRITHHLNELFFERLHEYKTTLAITVENRENAGEVLLRVPGSVEVSGTLWAAAAEIVPDEIVQEVRRALQRQDWQEVWRLLPPARLAVYVDGDVAGSFLQARTRRPGDRMQPLGMEHEKKVQDILVDKHIPRADRMSIPLFFSASHCIWLAGVCLDERARLTARTQKIVRLSIITTVT